MDLFDWFFPAQAQASHLRRLADAHSRSAARMGQSGVADDAVEELARENRDLRLYLTAIIQILVEKKLLRPEEVQAKVMAMLPPVPPTAIAETERNPFSDLR